MSNPIPLLPGNFYHIYNRGMNGADLFYCNDNYNYFLAQFEIHAHPVVDTFAWCLLRNHFHMLVRVKQGQEIRVGQLANPPRQLDLTGLENLSGLTPVEVAAFASKSFSNLFNAYARGLNKQRGRKGAVWSRPFNRKLVDSERYFKQLVVYIHTNPVKHGFADSFMDYPWSSYQTLLSVKPTKLQRGRVVGWFDGKGNFVNQHSKLIDYKFIDHLTIEY